MTSAARQPSQHPALAHLVSFFESAFDSDPAEQMPVSDVLERIRAGIWGAAVVKLRRMVENQNERGYQDAKRHLPAFCMSGACLTRDAQTPLEAKFISHSGILQCDFDRKDNPHLELKDVIPVLRADPHVLFGFISPSGIGLKAGVLIEADRERHADAFASAERYFLKKYGLQIDRSTKDPLRLCFVSDDEDLWINHDATTLPIEVSAPPPPPVWHPPIESTADDIREMLRFVPPRPEYGDWIRIASAVWSVLGMEEGCRLLAEWSPEEKAGEYAAKHRHRLTQIGVGTLVHYAAANGFDARAAARRKQWAGRIRFADTPRPDTGTAASDPAAEVRHVEMSRQFVLECFERAHFGDASLWAALVRGKKLYDHLARAWRTYKAGVWEKDDLGQTIIEASDQIAGAYDQFAASIRTEIAATPAPDGTKDPRVKLIASIDARVKQVRSKSWLLSVLTFAEGLLATKATQFDQQPQLLCLANGVIDFAAGEFREHRPADMLTVRTGLHFDPEADCPKWKAFLNFAMGGDRDMIAYLARAVGYSLTGYVDKDVLFFLYGKGANGKSTFTSALKMLGGELMTTIGIEALLTKQSDNNFDYKKAMLEGKRIVVTDEIPQNRTLGDSAVKSLVGGDEITARRPYERPYTFAPTHKLWLVGNHKPEIKGVDLGIWRRIHLVPWTVTIPEDKRRPRHEVLAELRAELPGILNWAIRGYLDMLEGGLKPPAPVKGATKEYQQDSDQFARFLEERTQAEQGVDTSAKDIHGAYLAWCEDNGEEVLYGTTNKVTYHLREIGLSIIQKGQRKAYVSGLRLLPSS
jgi:P4 family phage/plasmid primase-like protien